jgi:ATP-binding cassette subfamily F protein uup
LEKLPDEMTALADDIERAETTLADADLFTKDPQKFERNAAMLEIAKAALAAAEEEWLQLEMLREAAENSQ